MSQILHAALRLSPRRATSRFIPIYARPHGQLRALSHGTQALWAPPPHPIRTPLTPAQLANIRQILKGFVDKDGYLRTKDVDAFVTAIDYGGPSQIQGYIHGIKTLYGGKISQEDLMGFCEIAHDPPTLAKSWAKVADANGDGFISSSEFKDLVIAMRGHDPSLRLEDMKYEEFVKQADTNKDGRVSVEECEVFIRQFM